MKKKSSGNESNLSKDVIEDDVNFFSKLTKVTSGVVASPVSFILAFVFIIIWAMTGYILHYSNTWQLLMNTTSSIVTFLLVFLIQNTQNRDTAMIKIKLDELIRSNHIAKNFTIDLESLSDKQLKKLQEFYEDLSKQNEDVPDINVKKL